MSSTAAMLAMSNSCMEVRTETAGIGKSCRDRRGAQGRSGAKLRGKSAGRMMLAGKRGAVAMLAMSWEDTILRLLLALAGGAAMGLNRNLHRKSAGVRTFGLVSAGSAIVVLAITQVSSQPTAISPVVQGVLTGI